MGGGEPMDETRQRGGEAGEQPGAAGPCQLRLWSAEALAQADRAAGPAPVAEPPAPAAGGRRYRQGLSLAQPMLLPPSVDDYVGRDDPVRAIKVYVESLDLAGLGFKHAEGGLSAGQPAFAPGHLLGLYLYGYLNRVRSSRRLEAECRRNLEVIWLLEGVRPGYHTIANFRRDNADALKGLNRAFVQLCQEAKLFGGQLVGIDGSFFRAQASAASLQTEAQVRARLAAIEADIERYHQGLDEQDQQERGGAQTVSAEQLAAVKAGAEALSAPTPAPAIDGAGEGAPGDAERGAAQQEAPTPAPAGAGTGSAEPLAALEARAEVARTQLAQMEANGGGQLSYTDPDARRLVKHGKTVQGYNVQTAIDAAHRLILTHEVTQAGNDFGQLLPMAQQAKAQLQVEQLEVVADAGYYTESDIAACEREGITAYVPLPDKHRAVRAAGRLPGSLFRYDRDQDVYLCPAGARLRPEGKAQEKHGSLRQRYCSDARQCRACAHRAACLPTKTPYRQLYRSEHAEAVERHRARMQEAKGIMRVRAGLCEHPFGTLKRWLGWDHFLVRGLHKVRGEMALLVQCYNFRRALNVLGLEAFRALCEARRKAREGIHAQRRFGRLLGSLGGFLVRWFGRPVRQGWGSSPFGARAAMTRVGRSLGLPAAPRLALSA